MQEDVVEMNIDNKNKEVEREQDAIPKSGKRVKIVQPENCDIIKKVEKFSRNKKHNVHAVDIVSSESENEYELSEGQSFSHVHDTNINVPSEQVANSPNEEVRRTKRSTRQPDRYSALAQLFVEFLKNCDDNKN